MHASVEHIMSINQLKRNMSKSSIISVKLSAIAPTRKENSYRRYYEKDKHILHYQEDVSSFEDVVIAGSKVYEQVFGKQRNSSSKHLKRLSIIKIERTDIDGSKWAIYRKYRPYESEDFTNEIAVSYHSLLFLKDKDGNILGDNVILSKSSGFMYFLHHPNEVVLSSFIIGLISLALGVLSICISIGCR